MQSAHHLTFIGITRRITSPEIVVFALFLLTLALWLPTGFNVGFLLDEWNFYKNLELWSVSQYIVASRPFLYLPWQVSYALAPGQFIGPNIVLALLLFGKSWFVFAILRHITKHFGLSFAIAAFVLTFSSDSGIFYLSALSGHWAVTSYLAALYFLLLYWERPRISLVLLIWLTQMFSVGIYENSYVMIAFSPLILLALKRRKKIREWIRILFLWYIVPMIFGLWYVAMLLLNRGASYQLSLLKPSLTVASILDSIFQVYRNNLWESWQLTSIDVNFSLVLAAVLIGFVVGSVCYLLLRREQEHTISSKQQNLLLIAGLAIIFLGVSLYIPSVLINSTLRTYYFSSIGGALVLTMIAWRLSNFAKRGIFSYAMPIILGVLISVSCLRLFDQHLHYNDASRLRQDSIIKLANVLGQINPSTTIVVLDETETGELRSLYDTMFFNIILQFAYRDGSLHGVLCQPSVAQAESCVFTTEHIIFAELNNVEQSLRYEDSVVLTYDGNFSVIQNMESYIGEEAKGYEPLLRYDLESGIPARIQSWVS